MLRDRPDLSPGRLGSRVEPMTGTPPLRIALFSEVYWPMVSGVGVTLLRLTDALRARGHQVRVYTATYPIPPGQSDRPEVHRSPSVPLFLYPDVQWAFPPFSRSGGRSCRLPAGRRAPGYEFSLGVAGVKAARQLNIPVIASAHTDYDQYAARYGVNWALRAGWHYLRWFYGQANRVLCPSRIYEEHLHSHGVTHTGLWSRGVDPRCSTRGSGAWPIGTASALDRGTC